MDEQLREMLADGSRQCGGGPGGAPPTAGGGGGGGAEAAGAPPVRVRPHWLFAAFHFYTSLTINVHLRSNPLNPKFFEKAWWEEPKDEWFAAEHAFDTVEAATAPERASPRERGGGTLHVVLTDDVHHLRVAQAPTRLAVRVLRFPSLFLSAAFARQLSCGVNYDDRRGPPPVDQTVRCVCVCPLVASWQVLAAHDPVHIEQAARWMRKRELRMYARAHVLATVSLEVRCEV
jgi:hypothetical protein